MGDIALNFSRYEFRCKCGKCEEDNISLDTVMMLQQISDGYRKSIIPNSATRCPAHNKAVGGKDNSAHLINKKTGESYAVDIPVSSASDRWKLVTLATTAGFTRIGIYSNFIHLDNAPDHVAFRMWWGK